MVPDVSDVGAAACFEVVPISGKGHGCRALRSIARGERLCAESPLFTQGPGQPPLQQAVDRLSTEDRRKFFALTQNSIRFGSIPTARGIFSTNAHPCHEHSLLHRGIFPCVARFNHACDASAVYRWNSALNQLTVHATRDIAVGEEICVTYSFADGLLRAQRQQHLRNSFGFTCCCAKCQLKGEPLRQSEQRLASIGDVNSCVHELCAEASRLAGGAPFLRSVTRIEPADFIALLDARHQLLRDEFAPAYADGLECFLQAFVELCERAAAKLRLFHAASPASSPPVAAPAPEPPSSEVQPAACGGVTALGPARAKAVAYADAAYRYAALARDVTRDLKGSDSLAYKTWAEAFDQGVWDIEGGSFDFFARWLRAGLARHSFCHRELA